MVVHVHSLVAGLLPTDQQLIQQRQCIVQAYLTRWLPADHPCRQAVENGQVSPDLQTWFSEFEQTITRAAALQHDPPDRTAYYAGVRDWHTNYLYPLAQELHFMSRVEETIGRTCWRRGFFDRPDSATGKRIRPALAEILPGVRDVLQDTFSKTSRGSETRRVALLRHRGLVPRAGTRRAGG